MSTENRVRNARLVRPWRRSTTVCPGWAVVAVQVKGSHAQIGATSELVMSRRVSRTTPAGVSTVTLKVSALLTTSSVTWHS